MRAAKIYSAPLVVPPIYSSKKHVLQPNFKEKKMSILYMINHIYVTVYIDWANKLFLR